MSQKGTAYYLSLSATSKGMLTFSARLTGSMSVANKATNACISSQPARQPRQIRQTDIVILIQMDLEHRYFVEVGCGVIIDPFDQVLTASVIDGISHRTRRVQGGKSTAESERDDQEGLSVGHRAGVPTGTEEDGRGSERRTTNS